MKATLLSVGTIAALLLGGCSQQAKDDMSQAGDSAANATSKVGAAASDETKAAAGAVQDAGAKTAEAAKDATAAASKDVQQAGATVAKDTKDAGAAVAATGTAAVKATQDAASNVGDAAFSTKVKTALLNSAGLETKNIDVDTTGKTVTLKGSVPDEKQKKQAEMAAKATAGSEYKVVDNLTVSK